MIDTMIAFLPAWAITWMLVIVFGVIVYKIITLKKLKAGSKEAEFDTPGEEDGKSDEKVPE